MYGGDHSRAKCTSVLVRSPRNMVRSTGSCCITEILLKWLYLTQQNISFVRECLYLFVLTVYLVKNIWQIIYLLHE